MKNDKSTGKMKGTGQVKVTNNDNHPKWGLGGVLKVKGGPRNDAPANKK